MPRKKTPSFILELPLKTSREDRAQLDISFDAARQIYNAVLGESLKRLRVLRAHPEFASARAMDPGPERTALFKSLNEKVGFAKGDLEKVGEACARGCWIGEHMMSHDIQTTATRAFKAVQQFAFGKRGRPRFKTKGRLRSIEGKADACLIRRQVEGQEVVRYKGMTLPVLTSANSEAPAHTQPGYEARALACPTKYVRLIKRTVKGVDRFYAQFVQRGLVPMRRQAKTGTTTLDVGPSTIAFVSGSSENSDPSKSFIPVQAGLTRFCPNVVYLSKEIRRIQRRMDRSRRATNPQCFHADGTWKTGSKITVRSKRYIKDRARLAEMERRLAAERKRAHGELSNYVLFLGTTIKTERLSYKAFQKVFGRSVKRSAPALFEATLTRKAERAGGSVVLINTFKTRLSQACHISETYVKKPLSQRWHTFPNGDRVQRDIYSAFLAGCVDDDTLSFPQARRSWERSGPMLMRVKESDIQSANGWGIAPPIETSSGVSSEQIAREGEKTWSRAKVSC